MRKPVYIIHPFKGRSGEYEANMAKVDNEQKGGEVSA